MEAGLSYFAVIVAGVCVFSGYQCACPPQGSDRSNVIEFVPEDPNNYDRNYSSIADGNARPLGFAKGTVYYNQDLPNPCVHIGNAGTKRLEIMIETDPVSHLCVKDQAMQNRQCFLETFYTCEQSPGNDVYVEFSCDSRCGETDVTFWFRLALSPPPNELDPETWCADRVVDEYPSSLLPFNPDLLPSPRTTPHTGSATSLVGRGLFSYSLLAILLYLFLGI